jgi:hypothetical protein
MSRAVPWERLMREWVIYAGIMTAIFLLLFRDGSTMGAIAGVLVSGPLYLAFGFVMAKFGYQRRTMKQLRADRGGRAGANDDERDGTAKSSEARARPAPTSRTAQGTNRPAKRKRR